MYTFNKLNDQRISTNHNDRKSCVQATIAAVVFDQGLLITVIRGHASTSFIGKAIVDIMTSPSVLLPSESFRASGVPRISFLGV